MCGLLKDEKNHLKRRTSQLLRQEHVAVIAAIELHSRMDKDEVCESKPTEMPTYAITDRLNVDLERNLSQI